MTVSEFGTSFWVLMPPIAKLLLLAILAILVISIVRAVKLAWLIHGGPNALITAEDLIEGKADPDAFAKSATTGRISMDMRGEHVSQAKLADGSRASAAALIELADGRFLYLWDGGQEGLAGIRRACTTEILLTVLLITSSAYPALFANAPGGMTAYEALLTAGKRLLDAVSFGIAAATLLHVVSNRLERTLSRRKINWSYWSASLKTELTRR
jgi:hypothetical protein